MEKHTCKLCSRRFSNGRALGGHMRSHVVGGGGGGAPAAKTLLSSASSASTSVADDQEEEEDEDEGRSVHGGLGYVLRENPRKSFRLVDPHFSSSFASASAAAAAAADAGSCSVVQDRESDNESPRAVPAAAEPAHHRRRSKRPRSRAPPPPPPLQDAEPASSVSDATPEEDVALSLMMLSRDSWTNPKSKSETEQSFNCYYYHHYSNKEEEEEEEEEEEQGGGGGEGLRRSDGDDCEDVARRGAVASRAVRSRAAAPKSRSRYQCGTCKKTFRSYQALGGHRASHKKGGVAGGGGCCFPPPPPPPQPNAGGAKDAHACPFCPRAFASAQALGGHKRAHLSSAAAAVPPPSPPPPPPPTKLAGSFGVIDLNLPAPAADDDFELSAVSDADFGPYN